MFDELFVWVFGFSLHYTVVNLGTPNVTVLVALDTGSYLFWVPCDVSNPDPSLRVKLLFLLFFME